LSEPPEKKPPGDGNKTGSKKTTSARAKITAENKDLNAPSKKIHDDADLKDRFQTLWSPAT
jgi:hypothetical protein